MLVAFCGNPGYGKTAYMTLWILYYQSKGWPIYSNYHLPTIPHTLITSLNDLEHIKDGLLALDEGWISLDSRNPSKEENLYASRQILQSRKDGYNIFYTLQHFGQIDKRARDVTDLIFHGREKTPLFYHNGKPHQLFTIDLYRPNLLGDFEFIKTVQVDLASVFRHYDTLEKINALGYSGP